MVTVQFFLCDESYCCVVVCEVVRHCFDLIFNARQICAFFCHNETFSCVFFSCCQFRVFACSDSFQSRIYGNCVLFRIQNAFDSSDGIGVTLRNTSAPECVVFAFRQDAVAQESLQAEHTGVPANGNKRNFAAFFCAGINCRKMFGDFCVCIKAVYDIEIFCIFRALYGQVCCTAAAKDHHIDVILFIQNILNVIYRNFRALCFQAFGRTSCEECRQFHVGVLTHSQFHTFTQIAVT